MRPTVTVVVDCPACAGDLELRNSSVPSGTHAVAVLACTRCDSEWSVQMVLRPLFTRDTHTDREIGAHRRALRAERKALTA